MYFRAIIKFTPHSQQVLSLFFAGSVKDMGRIIEELEHKVAEGGFPHGSAWKIWRTEEGLLSQKLWGPQAT